jgi:peptidoglycan/xylan/chitin deacetylase (PgdA/CDA1 family)
VGVSPEALALNSRRFGYLTRPELLHAAEQGCAIELHGHAHHYPLGDAAALRADVRACADTIRALGLPPARHYCYPSGVHDATAAEVLPGMGVISATTCHASQGSRPDRYRLPRFLDGEDVSTLEFEAELSGVLHMLRVVRQVVQTVRRGGTAIRTTS